MSETSIITEALLSEDRMYRYWLRRTWDSQVPPLCFVMLNPSTADENTNDPTIRRCINFAKREKHGGVVVVNLYAYRTSRPNDLRDAKQNGVDIVGPENNAWILAMVNSAYDTVVAWGAHAIACHRTKFVMELVKSGVESSVNIHDGFSKPYGYRVPMCLGHTRHGYPRHPLFVPANQPLSPFRDSASKEAPSAL